MVRVKYIERIPRPHTKSFEDKSDAWKYWQKRYDKYCDWSGYGKDPNFSPKNTFDADIITLNKDGTPRKYPPSGRPISKKQRKAFRKAMELRKIETEKRAKLRKDVENKLNDYLKTLGYEGSVYVKHFKEMK